VVTGLALLLPLLLLAQVSELAVNAWPAMRRFGFGFLWHTTWDPVAEVYGAGPLIFGTVVSSLLALAIAVPLALGVAVFLTEFAPRQLRQPVAFLVELLAAVPSVVYGLWGIFVLAPLLRTWVQPALGSTLGFLPLFQGPPYGVGMLAAGIILAIMVVPFITAVSREVLLAVPNTQREAALALGATRWETTRLAVLRYGRSGLIGAGLLGLGRALGETMAVTMVIGNGQDIPHGLFDQAQTIASKIATTFNEASVGIQTSSLIALGFILLVITIALNVVARLLVWRVAGPPGVR